MNSNAEPYPKNLSKLAAALAALPGINRRTAEKIARSVATDPELEDLAQAVAEWREAARKCATCNGLTDQPTCRTCEKNPRPTSICIVETQADAWAIARINGIWNGSYHILGGVIDPVNGVLADHIDTPRLTKRIAQIADNPISEILLATSNTTQGNLTAQYLAETIAAMGVTVTVLSRGIANGAQIKAQAPATLKAAFANRRTAGS